MWVWWGWGGDGAHNQLQLSQREKSETLEEQEIRRPSGEEEVISTWSQKEGFERFQGGGGPQAVL